MRRGARFKFYLDTDRPALSIKKNPDNLNIVKIEEDECTKELVTKIF